MHYTPYTFPATEQSSVAARLVALFTLPSKVFDVVAPDGPIKAKLRLLTDKENQEVSDVADRYGLASRMIVQRREILARSVLWIEGLPIEMPAVVKADIKERTGVEPTDVEQKLWVFEQCQPVLLVELFRCYDQMVEEQMREINEIKKKFAEQPEKTQPETTSSG